MSGKDCTAENGNLFVFWETVTTRMPTVSIGDGGNELGCGKFLTDFLQSDIPNIQSIACRSACDVLVLSGVSNWGGYALSLALLENPRDGVRRLLSVDGEHMILSEIVDAGAIDPRLGSELAVDGMIFENQHSRIIDELLQATRAWGGSV